MRDPYLYPDTEVLKNLLGIRDSKKLQEAEGDYVTFRLSEIAEDDRMTGVFDFSALCRMHYRIFQDIYEWAGKPRIMNIEKIETVLNGISIEYSDVFDIERDAKAVLKDWYYVKKKYKLNVDFLSNQWNPIPPFSAIMSSKSSNSVTISSRNS